MKNQALLRSLRNLEKLDTSSVKRTIALIRKLRALGLDDAGMPEELQDLCFWWTKRRENRHEIFLMLGGAA